MQKGIWNIGIGRFRIPNSNFLIPSSNFLIPNSLSLALGADERAIARLREKSRIDERAEDSFARDFVKAPQTFRLLGRQSQPGHLEKFPANPPDDFLNSTTWIVHFTPVTRVCAGTYFTAGANLRGLDASDSNPAIRLNGWGLCRLCIGAVQ